MKKTATNFVKQAKVWMGAKEGGETHKKIIDLYNAHRPLAHGYELSYTDAWCAAFVSAVSIKLGYTDIIPTDCRCSSLINKFKKLGVWNEDENRTPKVGDIVFYDWEDSGKGNNKGVPNHVGIVSEVSGETFTVIEGNKNDKVATRSMEVNGKFLRGFAVPKYEEDESQPSETIKSESKPSYYIHTVKKGDTLYHLALDNGTTVSAIMEANADLIKNKNLIRIGWELKIPKRG